LVPILLILQKQLLASLLRALHVNGYGGHRVVVYGTGNAGRRVVSALLYSPRIGMRPVAAIDDDPEHPTDWIFELGYRHRCSIPVRRGPATPLLLKSCECEMLVIASPNLAPEKLTAAARAAKQAGMRVAYLANAHPHEEQWADSVDVDGLLLTSIAEPIAPWHYAIAKRTVDLAFSSLFLALLAPLLLVIALLIRLDSPGPALFVQKRVGLRGRLFDIYKFRSMHIDVPKYDVSPSTSNDRRITRIGRFLRRTSLDELPQLMNVLLGDMSLVGPRPEMPFIVELYDARQRERLQAIPGITGLWQLSADRIFQIHKSIEYDLYYIRNRTFCMDLAILIHTMFFAMHGV
jgi:exopolysaccharide biosynthesis polyprenyl glycosylphosphotransferase